jgi:ribosome-associated heat shock protein Hsp15
MVEKVRLDKYLWAIRVFKTRSQATAAIDEGKVKWNGQNVKPSHNVVAGEKYDIKTPARRWLIEVVSLLDNRVAYPEAILHYTDLTPEEDKVVKNVQTASFYTGKRQSKIGRPTKKDRRDLTDFMEE